MSAAKAFVLRWSALLAVGFLAAACVLVDVEAVRRMTPEGPSLNAALHAAYLTRADSELARGDRLAASLFAYKARAAARGEYVPPEALEDWSPEQASRSRLAIARSRLMVALAGTRRFKAPEEAARAQVTFDGWIESERERAPAQGAGDCEAEFRTALVALRRTLGDR